MKIIKKITGGMMICLAALSCQHDDLVMQLPSHETFYLRVEIPGMPYVHTRAGVEDGMIENMHVLVFDQNGGFLSRSEAVQIGGNAGDYRIELPKTDQSLPIEKRKRIIHLVGNCEWTGFSDVANQGKSENEIIMGLSTSGHKVAYWKRIIEDEGIKEGALGSTIELFGNTARISVLNNTTGSGDITDMTFGIGDYLDHGTVAPFDLVSRQFDEQAVIESTDATRQELVYTDLTYRAGSGNTPDGIVECYEHVNSKSEYPMYVIIKCIYPGDDYHTYYKVDIVPQGQSTLLDIQRNFHYILNIKGILDRGSLTLQEAMLNPASNNLVYSVLLEKFTSISYGDAALYVETTSETFVEADREFHIGFSYFPDIQLPENNESVTLTIINEDPSRPAVSSAELVRQPGSPAYIRGFTASVLPQYGHYRTQLVISTDESGILLRRIINIYLRKPSTFVYAYINPSSIPNTANEKVSLHFRIGPDFPAHYYPIDVFISVTKLSPNTETGYDSGLILDYQIKDRYRYKYTVRDDQEQIVYFKTILNEEPAGELILESDLFSPVNIPLN